MNLMIKAAISHKMHIMTDWKDFFPDTEPDITISDAEKHDLSRVSTIYVCNVHVNKVEQFMNINNVGSKQTMLVEECSFVECHSNSKGGCIQFWNAKSSILYKVCSFKCMSKDEGHFAYINLHFSEGERNEITFVTVRGVDAKDIPKSNTAFVAKQGTCKHENLNSTSNLCQRNAGLVASSYSRRKYIMKYASIAQNEANENIILLDATNVDYLIEKCNIISNKIEQGSIICFNENFVFRDCCLLGNTGTLVPTSNTLNIDFDKCAVDFDIDGKRTEFVVDILGYTDSNGVCIASYDTVEEVTARIEKEVVPSTKVSKNSRIFLSSILVTIVHVHKF